MSGPIRALVMAGGTGGHVFPALAVAERLRAQGHTVAWLGTEHGIEARVVPARGFELHTIAMRGLRGMGLRRKLSAPFRLLWALWQSLAVIRRLRPQFVLGMGGYAAAPGAVAARLLGCPLVIHEQNAVAGLTNRLLARLAARRLQGFDGALPGAETVGNPVREAFWSLPPPAQRYAARSGPIRILVVGGSQGARVLNRMVPAALARLAELSFEVRHQGGRTADEARTAYAEARVPARIEDFIDDMPRAYADADLVIARAGAMTVAEICASGCAALFVPFAAAVDDHQTRNAQALVDAGAARLIAERDLDPGRLAEVLRELLLRRAALADMAARAAAFARRDALDTIVTRCLEVVR